MTQLRPFQADIRDTVYVSWALGLQNVLVVLPTGAGKTVVFSEIIAASNGPAVAIAHRQELVSQISLALARTGTRHRIIGPRSVARVCTLAHLAELKRDYVDPVGRVAVAGVDTLTRHNVADPWLSSVRLVVMDEAHHVLRENKWGKAMALFPNAKGLGVSATPKRLDGQGLGRWAEGYMDHIIIGPSMRDLIEMGWLSKYRIFAPPSDIDLRDVPLSAGGDYSPLMLAKAVKRSHVVGDVVKHYLRIAPGKQGITFAVDIDSATDIAREFNAAGVVAEVVSSKTPDAFRNAILRRFRAGEIKQLVNVALFDEGFDVPNVEVVSDAAPTMSIIRYCQRFGRMMRIFKGKEYGIYIDHAGNTHRHGLPDGLGGWSLDRREKRAKSDTASVIPTATCPQCTAAYERIYSTCPYCGHYRAPAARSGPAFVDGDLAEVDTAWVAGIMADIAAGPAYHPDPVIAATVKKHHRDKQAAQAELRDAMQLWGGARTQLGDTISMAQRRFFLTYGVDVLTAQTLNARDAGGLLRRIRNE